MGLIITANRRSQTPRAPSKGWKKCNAEDRLCVRQITVSGIACRIAGNRALIQGCRTWVSDVSARRVHRNSGCILLDFGFYDKIDVQGNCRVSPSRETEKS